MHRAYLRFPALILACWAGLADGAAGSSVLQALKAVLNCGELRSRSDPGPALSPIWPWLLGSGESVIPCARMHLENASALGLADPPGGAAPVPALAELEQPAATRARQASAAATWGRRSWARLIPRC